MRKFDAAELSAFLAAVDQHLTSTEEVIILGGGALALAYDDAYRTTDIDTWSTLSRRLRGSIKAAQDATGLAVDMVTSTVADIPYEAESRVRSVLPSLQRLKVRVLDPYDVALSKTVRGYRKDLDAIRGMHQRHALDVDLLVERFSREMTHIEPARSLWLNFLNLIDHLFGAIEAERVRELVDEPPLPNPRRGRRPR